MHFADVLVRQAHPGPEVPAYRRSEQKGRDAEAYQREEAIPWTVLVDDLDGTAHRLYGGLADPTYLIDAEGRVAFANLWTGAPVLHEAIAALLAQGGRGVVLGGWERRPHPGPMLTDGWRALRRGLPQSVVDLMFAVPGSPVPLWLGYQLRPLLAPLTLRAEPLPAPAQAALLAGFAVGAVLGARWVVRTVRRPQVRGWSAPPEQTNSSSLIHDRNHGTG